VALKAETSFANQVLTIVLNDGFREVLHKFHIVEEENRMLAIDWVTERSFASSKSKDNFAILCAVIQKLGKQYNDEYARMEREAIREQEEIKSSGIDLRKVIDF
jgi:hypothetical protein